MQINQFELAVAIPRDGRSVRIREYGRQGLTFCAGKRGQPYSIIFRNNSPNRVLAVISVDGLDVVDGKPATAESRGYIVEGYASAEIKGWRTSTSDVRQFFFEDKQGSYSAGTMGDTSNCGVIACKVFAEKPKPLSFYVPAPTVVQEHHYHHHHWSGGSIFRGTSAPTYGASTMCCSVGDSGALGATGSPGPEGLAGEMLKCSCSTEAPEFKLGTGWGNQMTDYVSMADFERGTELATLSIYYSDNESLQKIGIVLDKELAVNTLPQGFGGFCQPPKFGVR